MSEPPAPAFTAEDTAPARLAETLRREPGHLGEVLRRRCRRREDRRLLVFVDQFEELYTHVAEPADRRAHRSPRRHHRRRAAP